MSVLSYIYQACRVVRYGTITVCTVRTELVKLWRTIVIVTLYRNYGKIRYGVRYGAKLALPVQKWPQKGLSAPNTSHFRSPVCSSHVLTPHNASMNDPEAGSGLHQLGGWHCQCIFGLRKASPRQTPPISTSSMLLLRADATQCFPERP